MPDVSGWLLAFALGADSLRRVYSVGRTLNDHFVAAVVLGCLGFYALTFTGAPARFQPVLLLGIVGIWALFFGIDRDRPLRFSGVLGWGSQLAYAFALWGGLSWWLHAPVALLSDRSLLWPGGWLAPALVVALWGTVHAATRGLKVRRHRVSNLPGRVVQLSDLHASAFMHTAQLDRLCDRVNALHPSLVVITGDLVMPFSEREYGYLIRALKRLEAPVVACPGNHDLPVLSSLKSDLRAAGIPLLVDEQIDLAVDGGLFEITGVNFHWNDAQGQLAQVLHDLPQATAGAFRLLLAHDPRLGEWVIPDRFELVLSGHTHGGQVAANMFGWPVSILRVLGIRDQGWFQTGETRHHVHRGNWKIGLPPRMGVAGEIAVFESGHSSG